MAFLAIGRKKPLKDASKVPGFVLPEIPAEQLLLSEQAAKAILDKSEEEGAIGDYFRVGIMGGGCAGMSYHFAFEKMPRATDHIFEAHGVKLCVDPKSLKVIGGSMLDFYEAGMRKEFRLLNKKGAKSCSCGKSFSL